MAERVFALFETLADTRQAIRMLINVGVRSENVTAYSTEPILNPEFLPPGKQKTRLPLFALAGGVLGLVGGYLLPSVTARMMDLPTRGQPIVSLWVFGVVIFEVTALGVTGGTLIGLLYETGLPRLKGRFYNEEWAGHLARGKWLISVTSGHPVGTEEVKRVLQEAGGKRISAV